MKTAEVLTEEETEKTSLWFKQGTHPTISHTLQQKRALRLCRGGQNITWDGN